MICPAQGGLATAFDLAAFRLSMIAPVKKSVNHSRTVASMRETGWEQGILGDPGADSGGEGKSKRAGKYGTKEK